MGMTFGGITTPVEGFATWLGMVGLIGAEKEGGSGTDGGDTP